MSPMHAVVLIDHHHATILHFDAENASPAKIKAPDHDGHRHGGDTQALHLYFGKVCDALAGASGILVAGSHIAQSDFRRYVDQHHAALRKDIIGWETMDRPTEGQLLAFARDYFIAHAGMARTQTRMR